MKLDQSEMIDPIRSRVAFAVVVVIAASVALVVAFTYIGKNSESSSSNCCNSGGSSDDSVKRIIAYTQVYNQTDRAGTPEFSYLTLQSTPIGSVRFLDPFGKTMSNYFSQQQREDASSSSSASPTDPNAGLSIEQRQAILKDADAYEQYTLIRLPTEFGGGNENVTSFRAYSDLDPESHCLLGYVDRPFSPTNRELLVMLQDPCHSDMFRVTDGYSCFGHIAIGSNPVVSEYNAIPRMRLAVDSQGYLLAIKPDGIPTGDGTVGEGRILSPGDIASDRDPTCKTLFGR